MTRAWLLVPLLLAACDAVFGLEHIDAVTCPAPGATPDEDGDGCVDTHDNCPGTPNADQADGDGDGVGDTCDPHPTLPGDRVADVAFFDGAVVDGGWAPTGAWVVANGSAEGSDGFGLSHNLLGLSPTIELGLHIVGATAGASSMRMNLADDAGSILCHIDDNGDAYGVFLTSAAAGDPIAHGDDQRVVFGADGAGSTCTDGETAHGTLVLTGSDTRAQIDLVGIDLAISYIVIYDVDAGSD